ncbi:MAG: phosphatidylserine decarboxylase family protein [Bacteroidia bacterium]|nr:phosphatidylserine decarboxylase family protein [Bacteroidia bacterium]
MGLKIHKEGKFIIPISFLILALLWVGFYAIHPYVGYLMAIPGLVLAFLIVYFFRNPDIKSPTGKGIILSPCDGKVVVMEEVEGPEGIDEKVQQISIFMSPLDVHVNRNPISGTIKKIHYKEGSYLPAYNPKSSELNEQNLIITENEEMKVGYKQIAGIMARRICSYVKEGESLKQGEAYGFIRFGSRMDIYIPLEATLEVELGQKVKAGQVILARL